MSALGQFVETKMWERVEMNRRKKNPLPFIFFMQILRLPGPMILLLKMSDFKAFEKENRNFRVCCSGFSFTGVPLATQLRGESLSCNCKGED